MPKPSIKTLNSFPVARGNMMKDLLKQFSGLLGTGFAAACCLGIPVVLSAVGAVGLSFIINDAYLMPLFAGFVFFTLWQLHNAAKRHNDMRPFWLGTASGVISIIALFLMVTGIFPLPVLIATGLIGLVSGSVWDFINSRQQAHCATDVCETPQQQPDAKRRMVNGAALAIASAGVFYGMYKSVDVLAPSAGENDIKCWGGNSCKGTSACGSALNSCTSQNSCKGKGWAFMPEKTCYTNGGVLFEGSEGDPTKG